jgi:hypothetical protein
MNNPSTADFVTWLRWLEFSSVNIRICMPPSENPTLPCQPPNLTVALHYLQNNAGLKNLSPKKRSNVDIFRHDFVMGVIALFGVGRGA